jgi:MFS family permease
MFDGVEQGIFPLVARPALQDLIGTEADTLIGPGWVYITALFLLGCGVRGFLFGWIGDRAGRVRAMIYSILAYSLFHWVLLFCAIARPVGCVPFSLRQSEWEENGLWVWRWLWSPGRKASGH